MCMICQGKVFLSNKEPRVQTGCPHCGDKVLPIGVTEEEFIRKVLDDQNERSRQISLPLSD